jgi:hypothetical protein
VWSADFGVRSGLSLIAGVSVGIAASLVVTPVSFIPRRLGHARSSRRRLCDEFCEPAEVLGDRRERELILRALRAA